MYTREEDDKVKKENRKEDKEEKEKLIDQNNSPVQLISQVKGFFYINTFISISFAITLLSFIGIPPIAGFFAKQMILSGALDSNRIFLSLVAILTSVIGAGYYLNLIKEIFFFKSNYKINPSIDNISPVSYIINNPFWKNTQDTLKITFKPSNITINSGLSSVVSIITLLLVLFIYIPEESFNLVSVLTLTMYKY